MDVNLNPAAKAVQESVVNLLELVDKSARDLASRQIDELHDEAQTVVLMFIAAIVLADEKYAAGEQAFLRVLVDWSHKPGGEIRYLNEYAERWKTESLQVPRFFNAAVQHDFHQRTDLASAMMRELQLIGNNTSASDGKFEIAEQEVVRNYIRFLDDYRTAWISQSVGIIRPTDGWTSV